MEQWKDVIGFEGMYQISDKGRVRSLERTIVKKDGKTQKVKPCILKNSEDKWGYLHVSIYKDGKQFSTLIHRLVAEAFVANPKCKPEVNHIDGNKKNNLPSNLEWVTASENICHAVRTGLRDRVPDITREVKSKPVLMKKDGKVIKRFSSQYEAARILNVNGQGNISACCLGKAQTAYGYEWEFE